MAYLAPSISSPSSSPMRFYALAVVTVVGVLTATSVAQSGELLSLGVKLGGNVANPRGLTTGTTSTSDVTLLGGVFAQVGLGDLLALGGEVLYEGRQFTLAQALDGQTPNIDLHTQALSVPIYVRLGLPLALSVELGLQYSYLWGQSNIDLSETSQALVVLGASWRPIEALRIGARFLPALNTIRVRGFTADGAPSLDIGFNVVQLSVGYVVF